MRRMPGFHAAHLRPFRRLCHPCRHIAAVTTHTHTAASITSTLSIAPSRLHRNPHVPQSHGSNGGSSSDKAASRAHDELPEILSSSTSSAAATAASAATAPPAHVSLLTVEQVEAFIRRHSPLCENMFLFSAAPALSAAHRTTNTVFPRHRDAFNLESAGGSGSGGAPLPFVADGTHRHSYRAVNVPEEVISDIRTTLDRLAQESHVLGSVTDKQRHRMVTDVCRIGYVVGLHSRCSALYVDSVLLGSGMRGARHSSSAAAVPTAGDDDDDDGHSTRVARSPHDSALQPIPDFVMDAAGEAADLNTLELCLRHAARAMQQRGDGAASKDGEEDVVEMGSGWLTALQVFVQCVRVALQSGWQAPSQEQSSESSSLNSATVVHVADGTNDEVDTTGAIRVSRAALSAHLKSTSHIERSLLTGSEEHHAADTSEANILSNGADPVQDSWYAFTARVLHLLHIPHAAEFLSQVLRDARYHYVDAGGEWSAAQAAIYACCFRVWLGEDLQRSAGEVQKAAALLRGKQNLSVVNGGKLVYERDDARASNQGGSREPRSSTALSLPATRLQVTCPAMIVLLRTAVAARQHDIAEWATLYTDACLEDWTQDLQSLEQQQQQQQQLDVLLLWYLRYLQQSGQRQRACRWLRQLRRREGASARLREALSALPVVRAAARLASESLDSDLALWCLQRCLGEGRSPTHGDIFACLCAFARCGLPTFDMVLQSLLDNGLLSPSAEEVLFVRLLHARRSANWLSELERCLAPHVVSTQAGDTAEVDTGAKGQRREQQDVGNQLGGSVGRKCQRLGLSSPRAKTVQLRLFASDAPGAERDPHSRDTRSSLRHLYSDTADASFDTAASFPISSSSNSSSGTFSSTARTTVFSTRVMYHILLLLQEGEHPAFMAYYRTFLITFSEHVAVGDRARWAVLALTWSSLQHGATPVEDVVYVVREVEQLMRLQSEQSQTRHRQQKRQEGAFARPRLLPIPADLYASLERKWAALYQQYPPSWWHSVTNRGVASTTTITTTAAAAAAVGFLDAAVMQQMAAKARVRASGSVPAFTRFTKRHRCLPHAEVPAAEMLLTSVRRQWRREESRDTEALFGEGDDGHFQRDSELWASYVASSEKPR